MGLVSSVESLYMCVETESFPAFPEGGQKRSTQTQQDWVPAVQGEHDGGQWLAHIFRFIFLRIRKKISWV